VERVIERRAPEARGRQVRPQLEPVAVLDQRAEPDRAEAQRGPGAARHPELGGDDVARPERATD